ncbi:MAG TPA: S41 family peptidase [Candidatus Tyrphobacter sp.]
MRSRALLVALVIALAAAGGALYLGHRTSASVQPPPAGLSVATTGNLGDLFGGTPDDEQLLSIALQQLERQFYKPIDPQTPFQGETRALLSYLRSKHIAATLPHETATGDPAVDASHLEDELAYAESHYGSRLAAGDSGQLLETAIGGIMASVDDPYTVYLSPREIRQLDEALAGGNFGGIGVYIYPLRNGDIVVQPLDGMPASHAGMKALEVLDTVDGARVHGLSPDKVQELIRGRAGTTVTITAHAYQKPKRERTYRIVREIIHVPTVHAKIENDIDYIRLSEFGETSANEMHAALLDGRARGAKGYILDLRDNGGGLVDAAVDIVSFFVPSGQTVVAEVDRDGHRSVQVANGTMIAGLRPLVILVNKYTASASEITSGALQDYRLATLVGTQTFGKGVVQSIYVMPGDAGALKITTARYVTPNGRDIQHRGIRPDVIVDQSIDPRLIDTPADKQLLAAKARIGQLLHR